MAVEKWRLAFSLLGPLEVTAEGRRLKLGGTRQQVVLATLLLEANRTVTIGRLMEAIYGDDPPSTSKAQVQICISALRRLFGLYHDSNFILTRPQGYVIQVDPVDVDAHRFESLIQGARRAQAENQIERAAKMYRKALAEWRGPALAGVESRLLESAAQRLEEQRLTALEACAELELELGYHSQLVGELSELVQTHPLRERLRAHLMRAMYRSGRQAEALQVYRQGKETMVEELGIDPGDELQQLEHSILTSDPDLDLPRAPVIDPVQEPAVAATASAPASPVMLPTTIADFTGRDHQLRQISAALGAARREPSRIAVPIVVIVGKAGIGKTTVAVQAAHRVAAEFPDGQLFANLHGAATLPVSPMQVLERFLRVLGVSGSALPETLDERAEMYRAMIAGRRMLIVLDDAAGESQVLPLLPGDPASAVIVTSRGRLGGMPGAVHLDVDVFDTVQSMELLARVAGAERVHAEPAAAARLAGLCGYLPLALRIAGARLSVHPHWTLERLARRLGDEARRLDELKHGDMGVRASLSITYEGVSEQARMLFRRLAILDCAVLSSWVGAALLDVPFSDAEDLFDELAHAQLVEIAGNGRGVHTQYRFHDLIRVFARERLVAEESITERKAALARVLGALLLLAGAASDREHGDNIRVRSPDAVIWPLPDDVVLPLVADPMAWFERERLVLVSGIRQAAQAGLTALCWSLTLTTAMFLEYRVYIDDWREIHDIAMSAVQQTADRRGQAAILHSIGAYSYTEQRYEDARRAFEQSLELFRELGDEQGAGLAIRSIGMLDRLSGQFELAAERLEEALDIFRRTGTTVAAAYVLHNLGWLRLDLGDVEGARVMLTQALEMSSAGGSRRIVAQVLHRLGHVHLQADDPAAASETFEKALGVVRTIGDPIGEAYALHGLGSAQVRLGRLDEAALTLREALDVAGTAKHRLVESYILLSLGEVTLLARDQAEAVPLLQRSRDLASHLQVPMTEVRCLLLLGDAHTQLGDAATARQHLLDAQMLVEKLEAASSAQLREQVAAKLDELNRSDGLSRSDGLDGLDGLATTDPYPAPSAP
ncbi:SARP family transcriptional regulator [Planobispora rosea]|uniref:SARP family transcriptional regulator n=1 Tax=Planobispora rosea TaxID=35762 RepID=A0A8J3WH52_PLARO|nr:AfsR/SARP family transcriptional regulator [Planobispora rosea]GGT07045.1 SARP family transcriptional regulator [Planobispora rosea]GIH89148.1 SARP family transcriptional regulator [Planobispora rosea]